MVQCYKSLRACTLKMIFLKAFFLIFTVAKVDGYNAREGEVANITSFPYVVLVYSNNGGFKHTGSVLNQRVVLSSPPYNRNHQPSWVVAGCEDWNYAVYGTRRNISHIIEHGCYSKKNTLYYHNIALWILDSDLPLGNRIQRVIISHKYPSKAVYADLIGFGLNSGLGQVLGQHILRENRLRIIKLRILSQKNCCSLMEKHGYQWTPGVMCAGDWSVRHYTKLERTSTTGTPLVAFGYHQIGLAAWSVPNVPGVTLFMNVSYYYNWIITKCLLNLCS